ncbi:hypothetical protein H6G76_35465 [Nostoc sp. FACHB-152]|nr:hypothetical protein [Nostoc sp. FACHB-152]
MGGQENSTHSWWRQIKSYAVGFIECVESGVEAVKEFLSILTLDECWGVMVAFEEAQPVMFGELVVDAPDWVEWMA